MIPRFRLDPRVGDDAFSGRHVALHFGILADTILGYIHRELQCVDKRKSRDSFRKNISVSLSLLINKGDECLNFSLPVTFALNGCGGYLDCSCGIPPLP